MATSIEVAHVGPCRSVKPKAYEVETHKWEHRHHRRTGLMPTLIELHAFNEQLMNCHTAPLEERDYDCPEPGCTWGVINLVPRHFTRRDEGERVIYSRVIGDSEILIVWTQTQCLARIAKAERIEDLLAEAHAWAVGFTDPMQKEWARDCVAVLEITYRLSSHKAYALGIDDIFPVVILDTQEGDTEYADRLHSPPPDSDSVQTSGS